MQILLETYFKENCFLSTNVKYIKQYKTKGFPEFILMQFDAKDRIMLKNLTLKL